ncbi:MAG: septum formation initiator family protein [Cyclobacteriaceae bacterium]
MKLVKKIPKIFKSFYFVATVFFLIWMILFDSNDLITQSRLDSKQDELRAARDFYQNKIEDVKQDQQALNSDEELLEKLAREKYLMKKKSEDLFIVVEE